MRILDHMKLVDEIRAAIPTLDGMGLTIDGAGARFRKHSTAKERATLAQVVAAHVPGNSTEVYRVSKPRVERLTSELEAQGFVGIAFYEPDAYPGTLTIVHNPETSLKQATLQGLTTAHQGPTAQELADDAAAAKVSAVSQADLVAALKSLGVDLTA